MTGAGRSKSVSRLIDFYSLSCCFSKGSSNNAFNCGTSKREENGILDVSSRYAHLSTSSLPSLVEGCAHIGPTAITVWGGTPLSHRLCQMPH